MCECVEIIEEYMRNTEKLRNNALFRGQWALFIYYQGMLDVLAQVCLDLGDFHATDERKEVT